MTTTADESNSNKVELKLWRCDQARAAGLAYATGYEVVVKLRDRVGLKDRTIGSMNMAETAILISALEGYAFGKHGKVESVL